MSDLSIRIDVHHHINAGLGAAHVLTLLGAIETLENSMGAAFDRLRKEVEENKTVTESAVTFIQGLGQQIRDAIGNDDALNELANSLDGDQGAIVEAIKANTPAAAEPPAPENTDNTGAPAAATDTASSDQAQADGAATAAEETDSAGN